MGADDQRRLHLLQAPALRDPRRLPRGHDPASVEEHDPDPGERGQEAPPRKVAGVFGLGLDACGRVAMGHGLRVQTHLSENPDEIALEIPDRRGEPTRVILTRVFAGLPEKVEELVLTFIPKGRARTSPTR